MLKKMTALLCFSLACSAVDVARIKATQGDKTSWGTCFVYEEFIITAAHVIKGRAQVEVLSGDSGQVKSWIDAQVVCLNTEFDVAYLKIHKSAKVERFEERSGLFASVGMHEVVKILCTDGRFEGFNHGGSGGPLYRDGKLEAMATDISTKEVNGLRLEDASKVRFVPASIIEALRPK